jgi:hypothetical protein
VKRLWIILAGAFAIAAVILVIRGDHDRAFIAAALGAVTWFLSYRVQMKQLVADNEPVEDPEEDLKADEEE